jgi:hypothetical protein
VRGRPVDKSVVGFGVHGGMLVTYDTRRADVGAFDDAAPSRLTRVLESAWGPRDLARAAPARTLLAPGFPAATVTLSALGPDRVTVRGLVRDGTGSERLDAPMTLLVGVPGTSEIACRLAGALGTAFVIPQDCVGAASGEVPGVRRTLGFEASGALVVTAIDVDSGVVVVEAEAMHNSLDDCGYDAFYTLGPADQFASNGVSMRANAGENLAITLDREVALPAPRYDAWVLTRVVSPRLRNGLARMVLDSDDRTFGEVDPRRASGLTFWDNDPHWEWVPAGRVEGRGTHKIAVTFERIKKSFDGQADLDAMAFVPAPG